MRISSDWIHHPSTPHNTATIMSRSASNLVRQRSSGPACIAATSFLWMLVLLAPQSSSSQELCISETKTFTAVVDLYGGELGTSIESTSVRRELSAQRIYLGVPRGSSGSNTGRRFGNVMLIHASMFHRILYIQGMPWHLEPYDWYRIG
jgi:hypothetical protein